MSFSPDQQRIILQHLRMSALSKAGHVSHAAQKCLHLRERLLQDAAACQEEAQSLSGVMNRQYRLQKRLMRQSATGGTPVAGSGLLLALTREQYQQTGLMQQQLTAVASGLGLAADNLLFTLLKAQFYQWHDRLYLALLSEQTDGAIEGEESCPLGSWMVAEGRRRFQSLPAYTELNTCHHRLHDVVETFLKRDPVRMSPPELMRALQETEDASQQLISALDRLDERIAALHPDALR